MEVARKDNPLLISISITSTPAFSNILRNSNSVQKTRMFKDMTVNLYKKLCPHSKRLLGQELGDVFSPGTQNTSKLTTFSIAPTDPKNCPGITELVKKLEVEVNLKCQMGQEMGFAVISPSIQTFTPSFTVHVMPHGHRK